MSAGITIHPRTRLVTGAEIELSQFTCDWLQKHELTYLEALRCFVAVMQQSLLKYAIRQERHPDDPEKKGDEA